MDRENLGSVTYWRTTPDGPPQRFYIAFCLLMSSVQDALLGLRERELSNLNWSTTCSYYALVHMGRLFIFLAIGDFPTSHAKLRELMSGTREHRERARDSGFPFDWLRGFGRVARPVEPRIPATPRPPAQICDLREAIIGYLEMLGVPAARARMNRFGQLVRAAGPLRNDSNYEALLIAHEYEHETVSAAFSGLAEAMSHAAEESLPLAVEAFVAFVAHDPDFDSDRGAYETFACDYLHRRLLPAIERKLGRSPPLAQRLRDIIEPIGSLRTGEDYCHLENAVSMSMFEEKATLMRDFESRIEVLRESAS